MKSIVANYKQKFGEEGFEKIQEEKLKDVSLRRPAEPEDIANVVSFLASHKADYLTVKPLLLTVARFINNPLPQLSIQI